jgi:hypothetical protein
MTPALRFRVIYERNVSSSMEMSFLAMPFCREAMHLRNREMASDLKFSIFDLRLKKSKIGNHQSKIEKIQSAYYHHRVPACW